MNQDSPLAAREYAYYVKYGTKPQRPALRDPFSAAYNYGDLWYCRLNRVLQPPKTLGEVRDKKNQDALKKAQQSGTLLAEAVGRALAQRNKSV